MLSSASSTRSGRSTRTLAGVSGCSSARQGAITCSQTEQLEDGVEQLRLLQGFHQAGADANGAAAFAAALTIRGNQHHDCVAGEIRLRLDVVGQSEAVHLRHLRIEQHERIRLSLSDCVLEFLQGLPSALDGHRLHVPAGQHLAEDEAIGGIVVHDQDGQTPQIDWLAVIARVFRAPDRSEP